MNVCDWLLTDCSDSVPCGAIIAPSIMKPLRVERESCVLEHYCHVSPICTLFAADHYVSHVAGDVL